MPSSPLSTKIDLLTDNSFSRWRRRDPTAVAPPGPVEPLEVGTPWYPIIAVPARNEAQRLPSLINALGKQTWLARQDARLPIIIVLNNCTDNSMAAAASASAEHPKLLVQLSVVNFPAQEAHVGSARRLAAEKAFFARPHPTHSVLLMTDADAIPEPTWVEANLRAIKAGADLVGGLIVAHEVEQAVLGVRCLRRARRQLHYVRLLDRLAAMIDPLPYDPWPRHSDHTGASIAVRADVYAKVGGVPALSCREDLAFVSRVRSAGYHVRHPLDVRVRVSARVEGRAPGGMADCLKGWLDAEAAGRPHLVEHPKVVAARLHKRRGLRTSEWSGAKFDSEGFHPDFVQGSSQLLDAGSGIAALIETLFPDEPDAKEYMPIEFAIADITRTIARCA